MCARKMVFGPHLVDTSATFLKHESLLRLTTAVLSHLRSMALDPGVP